MVNGLIQSLNTIKNLKIGEEHYYVHVPTLDGRFFLFVMEITCIYQLHKQIKAPIAGIPKPCSFVTGTLLDNLWLCVYVRSQIIRKISHDVST